MTHRDQLHAKISDLLQTLNINNNRLSLHAEQLSDLDVDVLRKQCIDLYETINLLPLAKASATPEVIKQEQEVIQPKAEEAKVEAPKQEEISEAPVDEVEEKVEEAQAEDSKETVVEVNVEETEKKTERSIHMKLQDEAEMVSLFEKFNSKPIDSIAKAITISKRFEFQNNFFDGDAQNYKKFIELIDGASDREDAFQIYHEYKNKLGWDNEDLKDELKSLLYRKYAT